MTSIRKMILIPYEKYERLIVDTDAKQDNLPSTECVNEITKEDSINDESEKTQAIDESSGNKSDRRTSNDDQMDNNDIKMQSAKYDGVLVGNGIPSEISNINQPPPPGIPDKKKRVKRLKKKDSKNKWLKYI